MPPTPSSFDPDDVAYRERLSLAIMRLTREAPFYAAVLGGMRRRVCAGLGAPAAVRVLRDRVELMMDPELIARISEEALPGLLEHEVLHVVLRHPARRGERDAMAVIAGCDRVLDLFNVACDLAVNDLVQRRLPEGGLFPAMFGLPGGLSAEAYYDSLLAARDDDSWELVPSRPLPEEGRGTGSHEHWQDDGGDAPLRGDDASEQLATTPAERERVIVRVVKEAQERARPARGDLPGTVEALLEFEEPPEHPAVDWCKVVHARMGRAAPVGFRRTWRRPSRRFGLIQKGRRTQRRMRLAVAIDTSGSISNAMLGRFLAGIDDLLAVHRADCQLLQCDAAVRAVHRVRRRTPPGMAFVGRGGTDFRPVFRHLRGRAGLRPDLLVYFTDLDGPFPERPPPWPTLWIVPERHREIRTPPFGEVIRFADQGTRRIR